MVGESPGPSCYRATWWLSTASTAPGAASLWAGLAHCFSSRRNGFPPAQERGSYRSVKVYLMAAHSDFPYRDSQELAGPAPGLPAHFSPCLQTGFSSSSPTSPPAFPRAFAFPCLCSVRMPFSSIFLRLAPSHCSHFSSSELFSERPSLTPVSVTVSTPSCSSPQFSALFYS